MFSNNLLLTYLTNVIFLGKNVAKSDFLTGRMIIFLFFEKCVFNCLHRSSKKQKTETRTTGKTVKLFGKEKLEVQSVDTKKPKESSVAKATDDKEVKK